jgi:two-component system, response regulator YesN
MKLKILLVDDEPKVLKGIRTIIDRANEEWDVVGECRNGVEAFEQILGKHPDVVITDIKMPCMGGLELVEKVKQIKPDLKFIILSGFADFSFAQQAIRLDTVDYLLKPPDYRDILKIIKKIEQQKHQMEVKVKEEEELKSFKKEAIVQLRDKFFHEALYRSELGRLQQHINGVEGFEAFYSRFGISLFYCLMHSMIE